MSTHAPTRARNSKRNPDEDRTSLRLSVGQLRRLARAARDAQIPETKCFVTVLLDLLDKADAATVEQVAKPVRDQWYAQRAERYGRKGGAA